MFIVHPTSPSTVAFTARGRLTPSDIRLVMWMVERAMAGSGQVHIFADITDPSGLLPAMKGNWARDFKLLGKLRRFGRVAIVSGNLWLRVTARIESALLPSISYRVFRPVERERAFAWVLGPDAPPR